jgi:hypothetical protein
VGILTFVLEDWPTSAFCCWNYHDRGCPTFRDFRKVGATAPRKGGSSFCSGWHHEHYGCLVVDARRSLVRMPRILAPPVPLLFSTAFQKKSPVLVTNDLYREIQKAQTLSMREGSPHQFCKTHLIRCSQTTANSLFCNILAASPCGSRFCGRTARHPSTKLLRMNILEGGQKKNYEAPGLARRRPRNGRVCPTACSERSAQAGC